MKRITDGLTDLFLSQVVINQLVASNRCLFNLSVKLVQVRSAFKQESKFQVAVFAVFAEFADLG